MKRMKNNTHIQRISNHSAPDDAWIQGWVTQAREGVAGDVTVRLVDPEESQSLNRQYRNRDKPTNVLSFPAELPEGMPEAIEPWLGDIVICTQVVAEEAQSQGKSYADHFAHMLVHGVLHLRGFDHITEAQAEEMEARECALLAAQGLKNPYVA